MLATAGRRSRVNAGAALFHQGDPADDVVLVVEGRVELTAVAPSGTRRWHTIVESPHLLGELGVAADAPRSAGAVTLTPTIVWRVAGPTFLDAVLACPPAARQLLRALAEQVHEYADLVEDLMFLDLRARVAKRLLQLVTPDLTRLPPDGIALPPGITHADLATLAGGSRENVTRVLGELQRAGIVDRRGRRYVVADVRRLAAAAGVA